MTDRFSSVPGPCTLAIVAPFRTLHFLGTFLFNSVKDASEQCVSENQAIDPDKSHENAEVEDNSAEKLNAIRLFSVWDFLGEHNSIFVNPAYEKRLRRRLRCPNGVSEICLWKEVYCCTDAEALINNPVIGNVLV